MQANIVVGLLALTLLAQAALTLRIISLRDRLKRLEHKELELFGSISAVRGWIAKQGRAPPGELPRPGANGTTKH